jgi:hypothetical protein
MNTESKEIHKSSILFEMQLTHSSTGEKIKAIVYQPIEFRHFSDFSNSWLESLRSKVVLVKNDQEEEDEIGGDSLLEIFSMATECIRHQIPEGSECDWVDERGVASWVILPKRIPIGWGYELHKELVNIVNMRVSKYTSKLDEERRNHDQKKKDMDKP